jgi:hypothetical protein
MSHVTCHTSSANSTPPPLHTHQHAQAFSCYVHLAVIRLFVESILRYGLPPQFQAAVVKPLPKMEARLRAVLLASFGTGVRAGRMLFWGGGQQGFQRSCTVLGCVFVRLCMVARLLVVWEPIVTAAGGCEGRQCVPYPASFLCRSASTTLVPLPCYVAAYADVHYWKDDGTVAAAGALASEIDQHPYVSITLSTGD